MKKLFSLVALAGVFFMLMSFNMKSDTVFGADWDYCNKYATEYQQEYNWDNQQTRDWYYECLQMNEQGDEQQ